MARRRTRSRSRTSAPPKLSSLLLVLAVLFGLYMYRNGYLDRFLGDLSELEPPAAQAPEREDGSQAEAGSAPEPTIPQPEAPPVEAPPPQDSIDTQSLRGFSGDWYQVYFTKPSYPEKRENRVGGLDETIAADIDGASQRVDLAVFDLDLPRVAEALLRAKQRGLEVRVVVDGENMEAPEVAKIVGELETADVPVFIDRREAFMHNKFAVLDGQVVWTGSANLTVNDVYRNNNNMLRIVEPNLAANYTAKMDDLMAGEGGTKGDSVLVNPQIAINGVPVITMFAPDDPITDEVVARIQAAQQRVDVLAFAFTSDPIAQAMIDARTRGLAVRAVMENRNSKGTGSEFATLQGGNVDVHRDGNCYIMHSKTIIIDGRIVITGSFNWTRAAQQQNDENVLIIEDPGLAARYLEEFERVYNQALQPTRCG